MEDIIARMQDEKNGIPIRTVKSFLSKIPSVFSGELKMTKAWFILHLSCFSEASEMNLRRPLRVFIVFQNSRRIWAVHQTKGQILNHKVLYVKASFIVVHLKINWWHMENEDEDMMFC